MGRELEGGRERELDGGRERELDGGRERELDEGRERALDGARELEDGRELDGEREEEPSSARERGFVGELKGLEPDVGDAYSAGCKPPSSADSGRSYDNARPHASGRR